MVVIDLDIALALNRYIEQAMARNLIEHVLKKRHSGGKLPTPLTIEINGDCDVSLIGTATDFCLAR
jgi:hypothetical protein